MTIVLKKHSQDLGACLLFLWCIHLLVDDEKLNIFAADVQLRCNNSLFRFLCHDD